MNERSMILGYVVCQLDEGCTTCTAWKVTFRGRWMDKVKTVWEWKFMAEARGRAFVGLLQEQSPEN